MASHLKGTPELRRRLKAIQLVFRPVGRKWGRADVLLNRTEVPVATGRLRKSFRVTSASLKKIRVGGHYTAYFVDKGPKPHVITAKGRVGGKGGRLVFQVGGSTIFARSVHHRGYRGRPFRKRNAEEALRKTPAAAEVIALWNKAA